MHSSSSYISIEMGNDLSIIYTRMRLNDIERDDADYLITNALKRITNNDLNKQYKIIGYGKNNIVICIDGQYYRIGYHAKSDESINRMRHTYEVIKAGDYGFVVPLYAAIEPKYCYYHIRMANERAGNVTYEELHGLFTKLLKLGDHGLAWIDYNRNTNLRRINGELVIIDFDCWDQQDIQKYTEIVLEAYNVPHDPAIVQRKLLDDAKNRWRYMYSNDMATLFAVVHGYDDPSRYMRLLYNVILYRKKCNIIDKRILNMDTYNFLMERPFSLL